MRSRGVGCRAVTPGWPGQSALPSLPHLTGHHPTGLISETFIINTLNYPVRVLFHSVRGYS